MKIELGRKKITEANIQAEFYHQCRLHGISCYLEYKVDKCRFDAVVYDTNRDIRFIIEFKSYKTDKPEIINTKQLKKYSNFNIQIILIVRITDVLKCVLWIKKRMSN